MSHENMPKMNQRQFYSLKENIMEKLLNDSIVSFISDGRIPMATIRDLISIREFIDRVSDKKFISESSVHSMTQKFGTAPDVVTWGDYFQTDLAALAARDPDNFSRVSDTVRFDIMSSWDIFSNAGSGLIQWVEDKTRELWVSGKDRTLFTEDDEEVYHLGILLEYYRDLGLNGNFFESELIWYHSFFEDDATGTEGVTIQ
jgi:hypothetical protein